MNPSVTQMRKTMEINCTKTFRTVYPYKLNNYFGNNC